MKNKTINLIFYSFFYFCSVLSLNKSVAQQCKVFFSHDFKVITTFCVVVIFISMLVFSNKIEKLRFAQSTFITSIIYYEKAYSKEWIFYGKKVCVFHTINYFLKQYNQ